MGLASAGVLAGDTGDTPQRPRSASNTRTVEASSPACKLLPMGLTVYYNLGLTEAGPEEARAFLRALREAALGLGFAYVEPLREVEPPEGVFGRGFESVTEPEEARWFLRSAGIMQPHPVGDVKSEQVVSVPAVGHALEFCVRDEGTETAVLGLARLAGDVEEDWRGEPVDHQTGLGEGYHGGSFCKTQYAGLPRHGGPAHFLDAHTRLIALLDEAERLGAVVDVRDDSGYAEHRDRERLRETLDEHNEVVAAVVGGLADGLADAGVPRETIQAPIREHPGFEHLEADGLKRLAERADADGDAGAG